MTLGWNIGALSTGTKHSRFVIPIMLNVLHFTSVHLNSPYPPKKAKLSNNLKPLRDVMENAGSRMAARWDGHQGWNPEWHYQSSLCSLSHGECSTPPRPCFRVPNHERPVDDALLERHCGKGGGLWENFCLTLVLSHCKVRSNSKGFKIN